MSVVVCFDLESSGLTPWWHEITEIGATRLDERGMPTNVKFSQKVQMAHPERADPEALRIGHYDAAVWEAEAVSQYNGLKAFSDWLFEVSGAGMCKVVLAGHNVSKFDYWMLTHWCDQHAIPLQIDHHCDDTITLFKMVSRLIDGKPPYSLGSTSMMKWCGVLNPHHHKALPDAICEALCYAILNAVLDLRLELGAQERKVLVEHAHHRLGWPCGHPVPHYST